MTFKTRPSQRQIRNTLNTWAWMANAKEGDAAPKMEAQPAPTTSTRKPSNPRRKLEAKVADEIKDWRMRRGDVRLWRNTVGAYPLPGNKGWLRYGLCTGSADFIGLRSVVVSPEMVGRRIAVFFALECKAEGGVLEPHQETWLNEVRDAGAIVGVARSAEEAEDVIRRWEEGK